MEPNTLSDVYLDKSVFLYKKAEIEKMLKEDHRQPIPFVKIEGMKKEDLIQFKFLVPDIETLILNESRFNVLSRIYETHLRCNESQLKKWTELLELPDEDWQEILYPYTREETLLAVSGDLDFLDYNPEFNYDKEIVLISVKEWGISLKHAPELKDDDEVVLAAVQTDGLALYFASDRLKKDKTIVLEAVKQDRSALYHADTSLKKDKEFVLDLIEKDVGVLENNKRQSFEVIYRQDKSFKELVVLEFVDDSLKKDRDVVLAAVKQHGQALRFADQSLQNDEIVLEAIRNKSSFSN